MCQNIPLRKQMLLPLEGKVTSPEWLLLIVISTLQMGYQLLRNVHMQYLIWQLLVKSGNVHLDALYLLDKWLSQLFANHHQSSRSEETDWRQAQIWFFSIAIGNENWGSFLIWTINKSSLQAWRGEKIMTKKVRCFDVLLDIAQNNVHVWRTIGIWTSGAFFLLSAKSWIMAF